MIAGTDKVYIYYMCLSATEFDSLAAARGSGDDNSAQSRRLLSELLVQMTLNKQLQSHQRKLMQQHRGPSPRR